MPQHSSTSQQGTHMATLAASEEGGVEALDGGLAAVPFAEVHFPVAAGSQELQQRNILGADDFETVRYLPQVYSAMPLTRCASWRPPSLRPQV